MVINKEKFKQMEYSKNRIIDVLYDDYYKNYRFIILNLGTHPVAYVEIPKKSKLYKKKYDKIDINVHGGLTYGNSFLMLSEHEILDNTWFIGWDYAHAGDYIGYELQFPELSLNSVDDKKWTTEEMIADCVSVIDQIERIDNNA